MVLGLSWGKPCFVVNVDLSACAIGKMGRGECRLKNGELVETRRDDELP